jgi:hypothetical protein
MDCFLRRGSGSESIEIQSNETLEVSIYTRAVTGASFSITNAATKQALVENVLVKHTGTSSEEEKPTTVILNPDMPIEGPLTIKIKAESKGSRFSSYDYLIVFSFQPKK